MIPHLFEVLIEKTILQKKSSSKNVCCSDYVGKRAWRVFFRIDKNSYLQYMWFVTLNPRLLVIFNLH